jgi:transposase InsO family protein
MSLARLVVIAVRVEGRSKSEVARDYRVSRRWVQELVKRFDAEGEAGLEPRSRRPHTSPRRTCAALVDEICELRKHLGDQGLDAGAQTIAFHLQQHHGHAPAPATIWRILTQRGFVTPQPHKRPKSSYVRFEADLPNERWQADLTHWRLTDHREVDILNVLDDHSRLVVASHARSTTKAADVVASFHIAAAAYGFPASLLTDNGAVFTATPRGGRCALELELDALGIAARHSRPYHPQTCGKVERFHQTLKRWLAKQPRSTTIAGLQAQLDQFANYYNHLRPHRALGRRTPRPPTPPGPRPPRLDQGWSLPSITASDATRSTTPVSSPCATTAGCTTSGWAAATPASACSSWWPIWTCGSSHRTGNCCASSPWTLAATTSPSTSPEHGTMSRDRCARCPETSQGWR